MHERGAHKQLPEKVEYTERNKNKPRVMTITKDSKRKTKGAVQTNKKEFAERDTPWFCASLEAAQLPHVETRNKSAHLVKLMMEIKAKHKMGKIKNHPTSIVMK